MVVRADTRGMARLADPVGRRAIRGVIGICPVWYVCVLRHRLHSLSARAYQGWCLRVMTEAGFFRYALSSYEKVGG